MTPCQCTITDGYCSRHKCEKSAHFVHLCQTDQRYFDAYERGEGPNQSAVATVTTGPTTIDASKPCTSCKDRQEAFRVAQVKAMANRPPVGGCKKCGG